jgi:hypothetical protein
MKWAALLLVIPGTLLVSRVSETVALSQSDIYLSSTVIPQGGLGLISIKVHPGEIPRLTWMQKEISLIPNHDSTHYSGFLGVDLRTQPGHYEALVKILPSDQARQVGIDVAGKDYGVRRLTLPKAMVDLDTKSLKRVRGESEVMRKLFDAGPSVPLWRGSFIRPVPGKVIGPFGRRSIINDEPRSPHSGVDLEAARGDPIKAINDGRVVLTADYFFSGLSVVVDHGGGIQSMYFHLDKILVDQGKRIHKGDIIGLVGSTGRATGPHLHFGMRINGARVDPLSLMVLSTQLEE